MSAKLSPRNAGGKNDPPTRNPFDFGSRDSSGVVLLERLKMKWKYREISSRNCVEREIESTQTEIHRFAEELSRYRDGIEASYPLVRCFLVWCSRTETWRQIEVEAETVKKYCATEVFQ